jgi:hypothetical protein
MLRRIGAGSDFKYQLNLEFNNGAISDSLTY